MEREKIAKENQALQREKDELEQKLKQAEIDAWWEANW